MLVLTRRINETIKIGNDIEIMVVEVRGDRVRLGFTAPQDVKIWRAEVYDIAIANSIRPIIFPQAAKAGMLILTRRIGETVMVGDEIEITVVDIRGDRVRLGFTAPNDVKILRAEVYERIAADKRNLKEPIIHAQGSSPWQAQTKPGQLLMPSTKRRTKQ